MGGVAADGDAHEGRIAGVEDPAAGSVCEVAAQRDVCQGCGPTKQTVETAPASAGEIPADGDVGQPGVTEVRNAATVARYGVAGDRHVDQDRAAFVGDAAT